jgi:hypothetical protein
LTYLKMSRFAINLTENRGEREDENADVDS